MSSQEVFDLAMQNNPEMINQQLTILTAQSNVAQAKAEKGLNANLIASFGLRDQDPDFNLAYPGSEQTAEGKDRIHNAYPRLGTWPGKIQDGTIEP